MKHNILLIDDDSSVRSSMKTFLEDEGFFVKAVETGDEGVALVRQKVVPFSLALVDYHMPGSKGPEVISKIREFDSKLHLLGFSCDDGVEAHNESLDSGALMFVAKDTANEKLLGIIHRICREYEKKNKVLPAASPSENRKIIQSLRMEGASNHLADVSRLVLKYAPSHQSVLIRGENGTGKERIARALHDNSPWRLGPFIAVNCHSRALRGLVNGGPAPLGYDKHPEKPGLLVVNEEEAEVVRKIFQTFLDEGSRAKAVEKLHALGIRPKRTSKKQKAKGPTDWTVQTLGSLLENTAYIGYREVNKLYQDEDPSHLKPWQKYQIVKAAWPAIISEKVFHDAQHLLEEAADKERTRLGKREKRVFLLTGILTCGEIGLPLVGQAGHGRNGIAHRYYHYVRKPKDLKLTRPRLSADELEEKVFEEFKIALRTQGYFADLEKTLRAQAEANGKGSAAEFQRVQRDLKEVTERISMIWANQGRMQLTEDALRLASEELNRLAKQKQDLEKYLGQLDPKATDPQVFHEQALFVENQIRWCLQGWSKATPSVRKRLLRRTIKEIVVTQTELCITFWTSAEERDHSPLAADPSASEGAENVVAFRRRSPQASDRNLWVNGSGKVRIGRECGG